MDPRRPDGSKKDREAQELTSGASPESISGTVETPPESATSEESVGVWRDRALRLQAEMENYCKGQRRLAEERILEERERLVRRVLRPARVLVAA